MTQNNAVQSLQVAGLFIKLNQTTSSLYEILGLLGYLGIDTDLEMTQSLECAAEKITTFLASRRLTVD